MASARRSTAIGLYLPLDDGRDLALDLTTGADRWDQNVGVNPTEVARLRRSRVRRRAGRISLPGARRLARSDWRQLVGAAIVGVAAADDTCVFTASMDNLLRGSSDRQGRASWQQAIGYRPIGGPTADRLPRSPCPGRDRGRFPPTKPATNKPAGQLALPVQAATPPRADPPVTGQPGRLAIIGNDVGKPWLLVLAAEAPPAPAGPAARAPQRAARDCPAGSEARRSDLKLLAARPPRAASRLPRCATASARRTTDA